MGYPQVLGIVRCGSIVESCRQDRDELAFLAVRSLRCFGPIAGRPIGLIVSSQEPFVRGPSGTAGRNPELVPESHPESLIGLERRCHVAARSKDLHQEPVAEFVKWGSGDQLARRSLTRSELGPAESGTSTGDAPERAQMQVFDLAAALLDPRIVKPRQEAQLRHLARQSCLIERASGVARGQRGLSAFECVRRDLQVDLRTLRQDQRQVVSALDHAWPQRPPQPREQRAQHLIGKRRRVRWPQQIDQLIASDRPATLAGQVSEQEAALATGQLLGDVAIPDRHLEAPTQPDCRSERPIHGTTVRPLPPPDKRKRHRVSTGFPQARAVTIRRRKFNERRDMSLKLGDTAPDFEADTTEGPIRFHDWIGDSWGVLFSHPKDFTPVCTTELGYMAKIKSEFDRRGVKVIGLSVDATGDHERWANDIEETQGYAPNYPLIGDADFRVSKLYGMLPAETSGEAKARTPADNQTVRNVFVIGPDKKVKLILVYPMTTGRNFDEVLRVIDSLQLTANHKVSTPVNWQQGDDVIIAGSVSDEQAKELFGEWQAPKPYIRIVPQPREREALAR